jgi:hypothetical protein
VFHRHTSDKNGIRGSSGKELVLSAGYRAELAANCKTFHC